MIHNERLKALREDADMNQTQMGKIMHVSQRTISYWEQGAREPEYACLIKYCEYFNVSADYILGLIDRPRPLYTSPTREQVKNQQIIRNSKNITINNK